MGTVPKGKAVSIEAEKRLNVFARSPKGDVAISGNLRLPWQLLASLIIAPQQESFSRKL
jgi:hypothetical protein